MPSAYGVLLWIAQQVRILHCYDHELQDLSRVVSKRWFCRHVRSFNRSAPVRARDAQSGVAQAFMRRVRR